MIPDPVPISSTFSYLLFCKMHEPYHVCLSKHVQKILGESLQCRYSAMHTLLLRFAHYSKKEGRTTTSIQDLEDELERMLLVEGKVV